MTIISGSAAFLLGRVEARLGVRCFFLDCDRFNFGVASFNTGFASADAGAGIIPFVWCLEPLLEACGGA